MWDYHNIQFEKINKDYQNYYGVDFEKQRAALLKSTKVKSVVDGIIKRADAALEIKYEVLPMSLYDEQYMPGGNRRHFEYPWFDRRNNCQYIAIALWLTRDEKYVWPLIDHMMMIMDEFTWCSPAHLHMGSGPQNLDDMITHLDLFHCMTGRALTDVMLLVGEYMPSYVKARLEYEIRRRMIKPMMEDKEFYFMTAKLNWAVVCSAGICTSLLYYGTKEEIDYIIPRLCQYADNYLDGIQDDGCCLEGTLYWSYGFSHFVCLAKLLLEYSKGEIDYFKLDKVREIALYFAKVRMGRETQVCFSDSRCKLAFNIGLICFLKEMYPDDFQCPPMKNGAEYCPNNYTMTDILWLNPNYEEDEMQYRTTFFKDSQWYVKQGKNYSFAAKGGYNREPHNHNDIGSFMFVVDEEIPLDDFGQGLYGRYTTEELYSQVCWSSRGHSVPIINGTYQEFTGYECDPRRRSAKNMTADENSVSMDIENAYGDGLINKIHREFKLGENSVTLTDIYEYSEKTESVVERFVSHIKPEVCDGFVDMGRAKIIYDKDRFDVAITMELYRNHFDTGDLEAYFVDFSPKNPKETEFKFEIAAK